MTKADKGNSLIILREDEYSSKTHDFIPKNHFTQLTQDITNKLQCHIRTTINDFSNIIPKDKKHKYINLNPSIPTIRGLLKIYKETAPVRPIINWKNAPGYKLAKALIKILQTHIPLPYAFNVKNTAHLVSGLAIIPCDRDMKLASFWCYEHVHKCSNQWTPKNYWHSMSEQLLQWKYETKRYQTYKNHHRPKLFQIPRYGIHAIWGLSYGSTDILHIIRILPTILRKNSLIFNLLTNHIIEGHFRYINDILIVYNESRTNIDHLLDQFYNLAPELKFTIEKEVECKINFLDITISRDLEQLSIDVYRKPTYSDIIIPKDSCHPNEHKLATVQYLYNRMNMHKLSSENLCKENNTIQQILHNNGFETSVTKSLLGNKILGKEKTMGKVHIHREGNQSHHKSFQEYQYENHLLCK